MTEFSLTDLATLARIRLSDRESAVLSKDLSRILAMVETVRSVPLKGTDEPLAMNAAHTVARDDVPAPGLERARVLAESPQANAGYMKVPKVLE